MKDEYADLDFQTILTNINSVDDVFNVANLITDSGPSLKANYSGFAKLLNNDVITNISSSVFNKLYENITSLSSKQEAIEDKGEPFDKPIDVNNPPKTKVPYTQYLSLLHGQTQQQKACKIRPHYLDIDSLKDEAVAKKEESYCLEEVKNEKIKNGEDINTAELADMELSDTQIILLESTYRLLIRTYLHEHILRAMPIFGYYDPQVLRRDEVFISFLSDMLESDLRSEDNTVYMMMAKFFAKIFALDQQTSMTVPNPKHLIKEVIKDELKNYALPKLAKRINEDTNSRLAGLLPPKRIDLHNLSDYYNESANALKIVPEKKSIYIRVTGTQFKRTDILGEEYLDNLKTFILKREAAKLLPIGKDEAFKAIGYSEQFIFYQKIYETESSDLIGMIDEFSQSPEYKFIYEFLFPRTQNLSFLFITCVLSSLTKKNNFNTLASTKAIIRRLVKEMATGGAPIVPDQTNVQDLSNMDNEQIIKEFLIRMLIMTPLNILKGYAEVTELSITIGSSVHMILKLIYELLAMFEPKDEDFKKDPIKFAIENPGTVIAPKILKSSIVTPAVYLPLGIWQTYIQGPAKVQNGYVWLAYLLLGLWIDEDDENLKSPFKLAEEAMQKGKDFDIVSEITGIPKEKQEDPCLTTTNPDMIDLTNNIFDGDPGYDITKPITTGLVATEQQITSTTTALEQSSNKSKQFREQKKKLEQIKEAMDKLKSEGLPSAFVSALQDNLANKINSLNTVDSTATNNSQNSSGGVISDSSTSGLRPSTKKLKD